MYSSFDGRPLAASRSETNTIRVFATPLYCVSVMMSSEAWCAKVLGLSAFPE